ncbi:hypothetical protein IE53DRAFT_277190 [Violaceomyces palustris]|uniref:Uncharacterized protein n=1 Tax=Violaceomyces palustris TaxID=1673888 RepID=A0ACD0NMH7_9BASI|nr:hypothetical protein IE53DRAFT_277190 [Violaceomyces palustris]
MDQEEVTLKARVEIDGGWILSRKLEVENGRNSGCDPTTKTLERPEWRGERVGDLETIEVGVERGGESLESLAEGMDQLRSRLNEILSVWKDWAGKDEE